MIPILGESTRTEFHSAKDPGAQVIAEAVAAFQMITGTGSCREEGKLVEKEALFGSVHDLFQPSPQASNKRAFRKQYMNPISITYVFIHSFPLFRVL